MKLVHVVVFGLGYVIGTRAGRERYAQIVEVAEKASQRLERLGPTDEADADVLAGDRRDADRERRRASL